MVFEKQSPIAFFKGKNSRFVFFSFLCLLFLPAFSAAATRVRETPIERQYKKHVQEMIDEKTRDFYYDMVYKEQFLTTLLDNLVDELKQRRKEGENLAPVFEGILGGVQGTQADSLIQTYSAETKRIVALIRQFQGLETRADAENDVVIRERAKAVRDELRAALDGKIDNQQVESREIAGRLLKEYRNEVHRLLKIFTKLQRYEAMARETNNRRALQAIERDKQDILTAFDSQVSQSANSLEARYFREMESLVGLLQELDQFRGRVRPDQEDILFKIDALKEEILRSTDRHLLRVLGYSDFPLLPSESKFDEFVEEWKANQIFNYKINLTRVRLLRSRLIRESNLRQLNRMFRRDLADALVSYRREEYPLAELQFKELLKEYPFHDVEDIDYHLSEIYMAQGKYEKAKRSFWGVIHRFPQSRYVNASYFKIMLITEALHQEKQYFDAYSALEARYANRPKDAVFQKAHYLTGFVYYQKEKYDRAIEALRSIPGTSPFALSARFLMGSCYAGKQQYRSAAELFKQVLTEAEKTTSNPRANLIKNNALLKLGMIYYENNEPREALAYFKQVGAGNQAYQSALIGRAWAQYREGQLKYSVEDLDQLFWNFMSSSYVYEAKLLSAHCNRMMGNPIVAARDVRYVENAKKALKLLKGKNKERELIAQRLSELDKIEEDALKRGDRLRFQEVLFLKKKFRRIMENTYPSGRAGFYVLDEFNQEKQRLEDLVSDLETYEKIVKKLGYFDLVGSIGQTKKRLLAILGSYRPGKWAADTDFLSNYPFLEKKSMEQYRKQIIRQMLKEIQAELAKIKNDQKQVGQLVADARQKQDMRGLVRLDFQAENLEGLSDRLEEYLVFLNGELDNSPDDAVRYYADFSGFGISDMDFVRLQNIDEKVKTYYEYIGLINRALNIKQLALKDRIFTMNDSLRRVQAYLEKKRMAAYYKQLNHNFQTNYFIVPGQTKAAPDTASVLKKTHDEGVQELLDKHYPKKSGTAGQPQGDSAGQMPKK